MVTWNKTKRSKDLFILILSSDLFPAESSVGISWQPFGTMGKEYMVTNTEICKPGNLLRWTADQQYLFEESRGSSVSWEQASSLRQMDPLKTSCLPSQSPLPGLIIRIKYIELRKCILKITAQRSFWDSRCFQFSVYLKRKIKIKSWTSYQCFTTKPEIHCKSIAGTCLRHCFGQMPEIKGGLQRHLLRKRNAVEWGTSIGSPSQILRVRSGTDIVAPWA